MNTATFSVCNCPSDLNGILKEYAKRWTGLFNGCIYYPYILRGKKLTAEVSKIGVYLIFSKTCCVVVIYKKYLFGLPFLAQSTPTPWDFLSSESDEGVCCYVNDDFWNSSKDAGWLPVGPIM